MRVRPRSRPTPSSCSKRAGHAVAPSAARRAAASSLITPRAASEATMLCAREALSRWCSGRSQAGSLAASAGCGGATTCLGSGLG